MLLFISVILTISIKINESTIISTTYGPTIDGVQKTWITNKKGNWPLVFVASHDGTYSTDEIPIRPTYGCYHSASGTCTWIEGSCTSPAIRDNIHCKITTSRDTNTILLGQCLQNKTTFKLPGSDNIYHPHFIYNNVERKRIDVNREINEGCFTNTNCRAAWNEFHNNIISAINDSRNDCGFAVVIDLHGHNKTNYTMVGYNVPEWRQHNDTILNAYTHATVEGLSIRNRVNLSDIINGPNSIGQLLLNFRSDYRVTPSQTYDNPDAVVGSFYFQGEFVTDTYGSGEGLWNSESDSFQFEFPPWLRFSALERNKLCDDLSAAIIQWVQYWHSSRIGNCGV